MIKSILEQYGHEIITGADMVKHCRGFKEISENILSRQEKYDGTGSPRGLKEEKIPLISRIIAVATSCHVITNERLHKRELSQNTTVPGRRDCPPVALTAHLDKIDQFKGKNPEKLKVKTTSK